jgi:cell division transport system ATP-binding protein
MIELHDVCVCYEKHRRNPVPSLDKLSVSIGRGEWVFLVGPSGAGKSTLLKLLYAGVRADLGRVIVDGHDISRLPVREVPALRRKIGIVFQDFQLLTDKTAWENVAFALRVIGVPQDTIKREVPRALETVGIAHRAHAFPHELSGGEQQRVAIARAIVNDPAILLTDEPTGNLDPQTASQIGELLRRINKEHGTTVIMATHDRYLVDLMRQRVLRLKDGHLISDENPGVYHPEDDAPEWLTSVTEAVEEDAEQPVLPFVEPPIVVSVPEAVTAPKPEPTPVQVAAEPEFEPEPEPVPVTVAVIEPEPVAAPVVSPAPEPAPRRSSAPVAPDRVVSNALYNDAPIGSPENPIVQYDR